MSDKLPSGAWVKTGYLPLGTEYWQHYAEIGDSGERPMQEAVDALTAAFSREDVSSDPVVAKMLEHLATYNLKVYVSPLSGPIIKFMPTVELAPDFEQLSEDNPSDLTVEILGKSLGRDDLVMFAYYLVSNTPLDGRSDPRLDMLNAIGRAQPTPIQ